MKVMKCKMQKMKAEGFTLIEMVIVILLVGILAAVAIPAFQDLTGDADNAAQNAGLGGLKSAVAIYMAKNQGSFPTGTALAAAMEGTNTCAASVITLDGITRTYTLGMDCTTALTAMSDITTTP